MEDRVDELARKIWVTKGARFNASRRLNGKHQSSLAASAMMSVYVVFLQLGPSLIPAKAMSLDSGSLTLLTSFLAIAILVISLLEHGQSYQLRAERLHRCGTVLNALYDKVANLRAVSGGNPTAALEEITEEYHRILGSVPENHDPIDNDLFRAQHRTEFKVGYLGALVSRVKHALWTYGLGWTLILGFPVLAVIWVL